MTESALVSQILLTFGSRPDLRIWRSQPLASHDQRGRVIRALPKGHADIAGVLGPNGRAVYIEAKSATGRQRPEQVAFQCAVTAQGALYILARSIDDVAAAINAAQTKEAANGN